MLVDVEVRKSRVAGSGLFLLAPVPRGTIVTIHAAGAKLLTEDEYQEEQRKGNELVVRTGIRWVGRYFLHAPEITVESYINHSDDPTLLYHCGISFARKDLKVGDELTIDYRFLLAEDDEDSFVDSKTGQVLLGLPPKEALLQSSEQLMQLLREIVRMPDQRPPMRD